MYANKGLDTMFERHSAGRLRLSRDARDQFGALLVVLRNECVVGSTAEHGWEDDEMYTKIAGSADNYSKMIECIDRMLVRLGQSFDQQKMATGYNILARAYTSAGAKRLSTSHIEEASAYYGINRLDCGGNRIKGKGDDSLPSTKGDVTLRPHASEKSSTGDAEKHVDEGPGGHSTDAYDSGGTGISSPHIVDDAKRTDTGDRGTDTKDDDVSSERDGTV